MGSFTYTDVPVSSHNPSVDQPDMLTNTISTRQWSEVDHYGYNTGPSIGGYHKVIRLPPEISDPSAISGIGQLYTKTIAGDQELYYESGNGVIGKLSNPSGLSVVASVQFSVSGTTVTVNSSYNISSAPGVGVVRNGVGNYTINFTNALASSNFYASAFSTTCVVSQAGVGLPSTTQLKIFCLNVTANPVLLLDPSFVSITISL